MSRAAPKKRFVKSTYEPIVHKKPKDPNVIKLPGWKIHFIELKYRFFYLFISFIITFIICCNNFDAFLYILTSKIIEYDRSFAYVSVTEPFFVYLKVSLLFTVIFIFPVFVYNIHAFLSKSKKNTYAIINYLALFIYGLLFIVIIYIINRGFLPTIYDFILTFNVSEQLKSMNTKVILQVGIYINFIIKNILFVLFVLSLPFIFKYLKKKKLLPWEELAGPATKYAELVFRRRMYTIAFVCIVAVSPPDFMYHFFVLPVTIFFMEIYTLCLTVTEVIYYLVEQIKPK